jgi:type I thyroxine 5'-deiodinase
MDSNKQEGIVLRQPRSLAERREAARVLVERLKYPLPVAIDPMDGRAEKAYAAWPERIYIIDRGRIIYRGGLGPFEFKPEEAAAALARHLAATAAPARAG